MSRKKRSLESDEFFTTRMVTKEKRSVYTLSGGVHCISDHPRSKLNLCITLRLTPQLV
jgi:hypothetical protein